MGTGNTLYSGTVPLQVTQSGSTYQLKDPTRGGTYTTDMNNAEDSMCLPDLRLRLQDGDDVHQHHHHLRQRHDQQPGQSAGADAQYGTNETWDYYKPVHGRNGIFGNGTGSYNRVHYGKNYVNAFWDGTKMTYGDGDGTNYGPLTSLDVAGHEMSHGVTENTAGLTYSGESGGLNEATSDIFGTMVEFYADNANDPGDYLIGEEFDLKKHLGSAPHGQPGLRRQLAELLVEQRQERRRPLQLGHRQPLLLPAGRRVRRQDHRRRRTQLHDLQRLDDHRDRPGRRQKIWYRALTVYMTSSTNYSGARTATLNAARDLYGAGSTQYNTVAAAWSAVAVS